MVVVDELIDGLTQVVATLGLLARPEPSVGGPEGQQAPTPSRTPSSVGS